MAASRSNQRPPSENESGVTLRTPITKVTCVTLLLAARGRPVYDQRFRVTRPLGAACRRGGRQRRRLAWMKLMASARVASLVRNRPRTAEVTVLAPGLRTP